MTLFLLISLGLFLLILAVGTLVSVSGSGVTAVTWISALRNVIIAILATLVLLAALPILETALS